MAFMQCRFGSGVCRSSGRRQLRKSRLFVHECGASSSVCACGADHESRRLASRRTAAGMTRRRFDVKVELSHVDLSLAFILRDLRQTPPRHSNLRFSASPVSRMPLRGTRIRPSGAARIKANIWYNCCPMKELIYPEECYVIGRSRAVGDLTLL